MLQVQGVCHQLGSMAGWACLCSVFSTASECAYRLGMAAGYTPHSGGATSWAVQSLWSERVLGSVLC